MSKKRLSIWILAVAVSLCILLGGFVLLFSATFIPGLYLIYSNVLSVERGIEYPPEVLDGNEDHLVHLNMAGLPLSPIWEYQAPGPIECPPLYRANQVILGFEVTP